MRQFSILVKPVSADCNLDCSYCFYLPKAGLYPETITHRMKYSVLERLVSSYLAVKQPHHIFGWQGGEPALSGVDFFQSVIALQKKYGEKGCIIGNSLHCKEMGMD